MSQVIQAGIVSSDSVHVIARRSGEEERSFELLAGNSVLVGSDPQCGFQLDKSQVSPKHCLLRLIDGELWIQDWCSQSGTRLDGQDIESALVSDRTSKAQIGEYTLSFSAGAMVQDQTDGHPRHRHDEAPTPCVESPETMEPFEGDGKTEGCDPGAEFFEAPETVSRQTSEDIAQKTQSPASVVASPKVQSEEQETIDLLRAEIELLQCELADRDAQVAAALESAGETSTLSSEDEGESQQIRALSQRLEQLLEELDRNDARVAAMEELLQAAEEANLSEHEERRQLEVWVGEIERRFAQREAEWEAEKEVLRRRVDEVKTERDSIQKRVEAIGSSVDAGGILESTVASLQSQISRLEEQLEQERKRSEELDRQAQRLRDQATEAGTQHEVEEAIREERLKMSQERAELSRLRAQLAKTTEALHRESTKPDRASAADERFRAFREHLKEIHKEEKQDRRDPSISERLIKLWRRLDSPTDRD